MREKLIEAYLKKRVEQAKGLCLKLGNNCYAGMPDRLVILPNAPPFFVELKSTEGEIRPLQALRIKHLLMMGQKVLVINSKDGVDALFPNKEKINKNVKQERPKTISVISYREVE